MALAAGLRHPKEKLYGRIVFVIGAIFWSIAVVTFFGYLFNQPAAALLVLLEIGLIGLGLTIAAAFYRAYAFGHFVLLSSQQMPALHAMVEEGATRLGLAQTPRAFVFNSNGVINAFAMRLVGRPYVMLTSSLIDADTDAQVRFVVGHELGHHAAGHLTWWKTILKFPGAFIPLLGPAYHRSRELTADRVGAYLSGDHDASRSALAMLACGSARLNNTLNREAFEAQESMVPALTGWLLKIFSPYPRLTKRVREVASYQSAAARA